MLKLVSGLPVLLGVSEYSGMQIFQWDSAQCSKLVFSLRAFLSLSLILSLSFSSFLPAKNEGDVNL